jgi:zinc transport system substrate-binding protein
MKKQHVDSDVRLFKLRAGAVAVASLLFATNCAAAEPKVVVTIKPVHALVAQVMAGADTPALVVDGLASPHTYALRPSDTRLMNEAAILFRVSDSVEPFTTRVVRSLPASVEVVTLAATPGLTVLPRRFGTTFEQDAHAGQTHAGHAHGAKAKTNDVRDDHVWLDPDNAKRMVDRIAEVLAKKNPARAALYQANAVQAKTGIDAVDADIQRDLKAVEGKPYVVFHDATQYFEKRYGLNAVGSITVSPDVPPSGKRLADLRKKVATLGATCVFSEPNFEAKVVQSVVEGTSAKTAVLDPEGARLTAGPELYATLMRGLAKGVRDCLAGSAK